MFIGMSLSTYTAVHVVLSLVGIAAGVLVLLRRPTSPKTWSLTTLFLATTLAGNVTGLLYLLAFPRFGMGHGIGIASLIVFIPTLLGLRRRQRGGPWHRTYVAGATTLLYLNAFIAVMLAHLLLLATCLWLGLHALDTTPRRVKPRRPKPLRIADRWN